MNGAFQSALAVPERYDAQRHATALGLLGQGTHDQLKCVYCSEPAKTWDHLHNTVQDKWFSGFGNRIYNLVPACRTCNESKGGKHWLTYLEELNPADKENRIKAITAFEAVNEAERFGWRESQAAFPELALQYEGLILQMKQTIQEADTLAAELRRRVKQRLG